MNIKLLIQMIDKVNNNETISEEELNALAGIGSMKFLLRDWSNSDGWAKYEKVNFQYMQPLQKSLNVYSINNKVKFKDLVDTLRSSVLSSFFTPAELAEVLVQSAKEIMQEERIEVKNILEPAAGSGRFVTQLVKEFPTSSILAIEKEPIIASLSKAHFNQIPNVRFLNTEFQRIPLENKYDLIISNIPFVQIGVNDTQMPKETKKYLNSLHSYYFAKSTELLSQGGVCCFISTNAIMDNNIHQPLRNYLVKNLDLVSAVRLPNNIFASENTQVTTDIILFKKPIEQKRNLSIHEKMFAAAAAPIKTDKDILINQYFTHNIGNILGEIVKGSQYSQNTGYSVMPTHSTDKINELVHKLLIQNSSELVKSISKPVVNNVSQLDLFATIQSLAPVNTREAIIKWESAYDGVGNIIKLENDPNTFILLERDLADSQYAVRYFDAEELIKGNLPNKAKLLNNFIELRRNSIAILNEKSKQLASSTDYKERQKRLNSLYDEFLDNTQGKKINEVFNLNTFIDGDTPIVLALEKQDAQTKEYEKCDLFHNRIINDEDFLTDDIYNACIYSYNKVGYLDLHLISHVTNLEQQEVIAQALQSKVARFDPTDENKLVFANHFKSGDVKAKINALNSLMAGGKPEYLTNDILIAHINELDEIVPEFVNIQNIQPQLGEVMFNMGVYKKFFAEYLNISTDEIQLHRINSSYKVLLTNRAYYLANKIAVDSKEHTKFTGIDMMETLLNNVQKNFTYTEDKVQYIDHTANATFARLKSEILKSWDEFAINDTPVRNHIETKYNSINSILPVIADGSNVDYTELTNIGITPRSYQLDGISHVIENNGGLIDHATGAGKTILLAMAAMKMKRMGIVNKPLVCGLNANIEAITRQVKQLYPDAKILYADKKSYQKKNRQKFFATIANNDWDMVIMSHSQFSEIPLNKEAQIKVIEEEIDNIEKNIALLHSVDRIDLQQRLTKKQLSGLIKRKETLKLQIDELNNNTDKISLDIVKLGVDHLIIDEAHLYKNLKFQTIHYRVPGLSNSSSKRAGKLNVHLHAIRDNFYNGEDKGFTFVSATPIVNSIAEMYTLFKLVKPSILKQLDVENFDTFIQMFAKFENDLEISVTGGYSFKTRCRNFIKVNLLMNYYNAMAHVVTNDQVNDEIMLPKATNHHINIPRTPEQEQYLYDLIEFSTNGNSENIQKVGKEVNGAEMLMVSTKSNLASIDMRLIDNDVYNDYSSFNENTKLNVACKEIAKIYLNEDSKQGTQLVFCDQGTPQSKNDELSFYDLIKEKLVNNYKIPSNQIVFIHDFKDDAALEKLENKFNEGEIRICIGSTAKLGTGKNFQAKLKAIHNLDVPWRPIDYEQRLGRVVRQGNSYDKVDVFYYTTEKTLDAFRFEVLKHKQNFINQIKKYGNTAHNSLKDDIADGDDIRYVDMVAEITGDSMVKELAQKEKEYDMVNSYYLTKQKENNTIHAQLMNAKRELEEITIKCEGYTKAYNLTRDFIANTPENDIKFTLSNNECLSANKFGEHVLNTIKAGGVFSQDIAEIKDTDRTLAKVVLNYNHTNFDYSLKLQVLDENKEVVITTAYNRGSIAKNPNTVGKNPIQAMINLETGMDWAQNKKEISENKLSKLQEKKDAISIDTIRELHLQSQKIQGEIVSLRQILSSQRKEFVNNEDRIKYIDIKNSTFRKVAEERKNSKNKVVGLEF